MEVSSTKFDLPGYQKASQKVQHYFDSKAPYDKEEWLGIIDLVLGMMDYEARTKASSPYEEKHHG